MRKNFLLTMLIMVFLVACGQSPEDPLATTDEVEKTEQQEDATETNEKNEEEEKSEEEETDTSSSEDQSESTEEIQSGPLSDLTVHYIDVGQADATLLQFENYNILYDTGDWRGSQVVSYLKGQNVSEIDLVIVSHPDADHVGQLEDVIGAFNVGEVWMTGNESSSKTFQAAVTGVINSGADYHEPRTGESFEMGNMDIEVVYPNSISGKSNEESLSALFTYGDVSFLFTGDAGKSAERSMMNAGVNLDADILQLGHHGSNTSSDPGFINKVSPSVAIYSAGAGNSYGHPHAEVVSQIENAGIKLYGTDVHGTIIVTTDGKDYSIQTKQDGTISPKNENSSSKSSTSETKKKEDTTKSKSNTGSCVDINTASLEEVQQIKHIGPARSEELLAKRPYSSVDGLSAINGIGPARIQDIKDEGIACVQ